MRGIQYAAASRRIAGVSGILDYPLSRIMTVVDVKAWRARHRQAAPGIIKIVISSLG
jgi:hypothetical protein